MGLFDDIIGIKNELQNITQEVTEPLQQAASEITETKEQISDQVGSLGNIDNLNPLDDKQE